MCANSTGHSHRPPCQGTAPPARPPACPPVHFPGHIFTPTNSLQPHHHPGASCPAPATCRPLLQVAQCPVAPTSAPGVPGLPETASEAPRPWGGQHPWTTETCLPGGILGDKQGVGTGALRRAPWLTPGQGWTELPRLGPPSARNGQEPGLSMGVSVSLAPGPSGAHGTGSPSPGPPVSRLEEGPCPTDAPPWAPVSLAWLGGEALLPPWVQGL